MKTLRNIGLIPGAMLDIWKSFLFGMDGKGRPMFPLLGLILLALCSIISSFIGGAEIDAHYGCNFAFWFCGLFTLFVWTFGFPAAIYLIDLNNKHRY